MPTFFQGHVLIGIESAMSLRLTLEISIAICSSRHLVRRTCSGWICKDICRVLMNTSPATSRRGKELFVTIYRINLTLLLDGYIDDSSSSSRMSLSYC